jgi:hypothetical protein
MEATTIPFTEIPNGTELIETAIRESITKQQPRPRTPEARERIIQRTLSQGVNIALLNESRERVIALITFKEAYLTKEDELKPPALLVTSYYIAPEYRKQKLQSSFRIYF